MKSWRSWLNRVQTMNYTISGAGWKGQADGGGKDYLVEAVIDIELMTQGHQARIIAV